MQVLLDRDTNRLVFDPPELGCVLYLPGLPHAGAKIHDRSPYGNYGTITGATWARLPSGLWCLYFDGSDDRVDWGNNALFEFSGANTQGTIEAWIYPETATEFASIIARGGGVHADINWWLAWPTGRTVTGHLDTGSAWCLEAVSSALSLTQWHHIVYIFNAGQDDAKIYVNGVDNTASTTGLTGVPQSITADMTMGCSPIAIANRFDGTIARVRLYNRVLTALEIHNHFTQEKHLFGVW